MRLHDVPITNEGSVVRYTVVASLDSQDFTYRKVHFEFACELITIKLNEIILTQRLS